MTPTGLVPLPRRPVLLIALGTSAMLLVLAPRYGWHRDELYFLEAGRHLAWGYVDQPPFTPLVARLSDVVAPGNLVVLRLLPALATAATIALGASIVREFGGDRRAQVLGAAAVASGGFVLGVGHLLSTAAFDLTAWMALLWVAARLLRTGDPRWWLAFGGVAGLALLNKSLVVLLVVSLAVGLVIGRRWDLLLSPWLIAGGVLAVGVAAPNLLWQADHGWPQRDMADALEARIGGENRTFLFPMQVLFVGPVLVAAGTRGVRWLTQSPFGALLWAWPVALAITLVSGGRPYYVVPLTTVVMLAGVAATLAEEQRGLGRLAVAGIAIGAVIALPILPRSTAAIAASVNEAVAETIGWPELVDQVAEVVDALPAAERPSVILLTGTYGEAGALDRFGPARGLPPAYSPHNGYADFRMPQDETATVVAVRMSEDLLAPYFETCEVVDHVDIGLDIENEIQGEPIMICRGLVDTWPATWSKLRFLS